MSVGLSAQWDAHAGIAVPLSQNATADASTMDNLVSLVLDGDQNTSWESDFAFPFPYLSQPHRNILLNTPDSLFCSSLPKDSLFADSIFTNSILVDSFFLDSVIVQSITMDTMQIDSIFTDTIIVDSIAYSTVLVDSVFFNTMTMMNDTVQVDSILIDTFMVDSLFTDTIVVENITFDTMMIDSIFLDSILIDSMFMDTLSINIGNIDNNDYSIITDANTDLGNVFIPVVGGYSWLGITFDTLRPLLAISVKMFSQSDVDIYVYTSPMDSVLVGTYIHGDEYNYQLKRFLVEEDSAYQIKMWSESEINIFELAGLDDYPKESVVVDLGSSQSLGQIVTRYWAGVDRAEASVLYISEDSLNWYELVNLDPNNSGVLSIQVDIDTTARYIRLEHSLALLDYERVYVWEIGVFDEEGVYTDYPSAKPGDKTLYEMLGMNALWGWGYNIYSDLIPDGEGPATFDTISSFARNYHFMDWDVPVPDSIPDYSNMAVSGTYPGKSWLDWDREYQAWIDEGLEPHACIMFSHAFPSQDTFWTEDFGAAYHYGYEFAKYFGPTQGNGKIKKMEIGNEPWFFESDDYRMLMSQMAQGIKDADQAMEVFPCALQAHDSITENSIIGLKNYIGTRITPADTMNLDGVNIHAYCWDIDSMGQRISTPPELKTNEFRSINSMIKWRDENMPNKKLIVSEWGYDIESPNEPCIHSECVSERAGAVYTTRAALIMHRLGIDEATVFWFANSTGASTTFNRSGLLESIDNNFNKKNAFVALTSLVDSLGQYYFDDVIQEDDDAYMYLYADSLGHPSHLVAWSPNDGDDTQEFDASWTHPDYVPLHATRIIGEQDGGTSLPKPTYIEDTMHFTISSAPTIIRLVANPCVDHLTVSTIGNSNIYAADSTLISDAVLPSGSTDTIQYQAGQSITLEPGFCSGDSTNFKVNIEDCDVEELLGN